MRFFPVLLLPLLFASACAHRLAPGALSDIKRPAFVSRIDKDSGPTSTVFHDDESYAARLAERKLDVPEADRRMSRRMAKGISRFETSDRIRAVVMSELPPEPPWSNALHPATVASALETLLVQEVPPKDPDYERLKHAGADSVVEFVVRNYGMRSKEGKGFAFVEGYGRFFRIDGGQIWTKSFAADGLAMGRAPLDPFAVSKDPQLFRNEMAFLLNAVGAELAKELSPQESAASREREQKPAMDKGAPAEAQPDSDEL
jgi:hypothetical protein